MRDSSEVFGKGFVSGVCWTLAPMNAEKMLRLLSFLRDRDDESLLSIMHHLESASADIYRDLDGLDSESMMRVVCITHPLLETSVEA